MKAMVLDAPRRKLKLAELPVPQPAAGQVLIKVHACGVCRTDLHIVDGDLPDGKLPIIPGHEIVGIVAGKGAAVERFNVGDRVGVPWLGYTCGTCDYCKSGRENLCDGARFTGYHLDGGYAEYTLADQRYCFALPYDILWGERRIQSVANLTRRDGEEFLKLAPQVPVRTATETFDLTQANEALTRLRDGKITGAAVLVMGGAR